MKKSDWLAQLCWHLAGAAAWGLLFTAAGIVWSML